MFNIYWTLGLSAFSLLVGLFTGYKFEADRFQNFRESVIVAQKVAEVETKRREAESQNVTKEINNAYQDDIATIHRFYANRLQHGSTGKLPQVSGTTSRLDEIISDPGFAESCTITTSMLYNLQQWIKEQQKVWMTQTEPK